MKDGISTFNLSTFNLSTFNLSTLTFSLSQLHHFLLIITEEGLLDTTEKFLFKEQPLDSALELFLKEVGAALDELNPIDFNEKNKLIAQIKSLLNKIAEGSSANDVVGQCVKSFFQKSDVLDKSNIKTAICRLLFIDELRLLLPEADKNKGLIQLCFKKFMGQLLSLGYANIVESIHLFMNISRKIFNSQSKEMEDPLTYVSKYISPCLMDGLNLNGYLSVHELEGSMSPRSKEINLSIRLAKSILELDIFDLAMREVNYKQWHQDKEAFDLLLEKMMYRTYCEDSPLYLSCCYDEKERNHDKDKLSLSNFFQKLRLHEKKPGKSPVSPRFISSAETSNPSEKIKYKKLKDGKRKNKKEKEKEKEEVSFTKKSPRDPSDSTPSPILTKYDRKNLKKQSHSEQDLKLSSSPRVSSIKSGSMIRLANTPDEKPKTPRNNHNG